MDRLADDLLSGVAEIAAHTGMTERSIYHLASKGELPVFRLGKIICARKSELDAKLRAAAA